MRLRPSPATVIALIALFVALGGPAWAKKLIVNGSQIVKDSITSRQIRAASLSRTDLSASTIRFLQRTPDRAIRSSQIATGAISGDKLAPASVGTVAVADNTLTATDIAPGSLTKGVLAADSVGFDEIADSAVGKAALRAAAVGQAEIGDEAVASEEIKDGKARMVDLGSFAGVATVTFPDILTETCQTADVPVTPITAATQPDLTKTFILVGQPGNWPEDNVTISGKAKDATTLHLTACNNTAQTVTTATLTNVLIPYVALVP